MRTGIDISHWQGNINWATVKNSGIEFAIIKAGGSDAGFYTDSKFEENYAQAKEVGMPIGAYYFVGAGCISTDDGVADANRFIAMLAGKTFEYPVYMDVESTNPADKSGVTDAVIGFCETMENAGYFVGVYGSDDSGFRSRMDDSRLSEYDHWVARYGSEPKLVSDYGMWQYSSTGSVAGINGNVDMDNAYKDYPAIIISAGLNGFEKNDTPANSEPVSTPTPAPSTAHHVGENVSFSVIFVSSDSDNALMPLYPNGEITSIKEGARNPYLINNGMGWVNDDAINGTESASTGISRGDVVSGSKVRVNSGTNYNGVKVKAWFNDEGYDVGEVNGDRAVLYHDGSLFDAFHVSDLTVI